MIEFDAVNHTYILDGQPVPSVTQILTDMGLIDATWFTDYSRERGKLVHRIIQWHLSGELDETTVDDTLRGYLDAWKRFEVYAGFTPTAIEKPLASSVYHFAGTPDYIGTLNGVEVIIDAKTGTIFPAMALQLSGYEILAEKCLKRFALQLTETGKYKLTPFVKRTDRGTFLAAVTIWYWKQNNLKGENNGRRDAGNRHEGINSY